MNPKPYKKVKFCGKINKFLRKMQLLCRKSANFAPTLLYLSR